MKAQIILVFSWLGQVVAFSATPTRKSKAPSGSRLWSSRSYLESLSSTQSSGGLSQAQPPKAFPPQSSTTTTTVSTATPKLAYASEAYFALEGLRSKGVRGTKDWGAPEEGTRSLAETEDEMFSVGSWSCTAGGWPSPNPKGHTEIFYMVQGHGCLSDEDGAKHYFGPGDTVIIPKGHTGRWDVYDTIHKIWAVRDHEKVEEHDRPVRVQVHHYHTSVASHYLTGASVSDPLYGVLAATCDVSYKVLYSVGPAQVGTCACDEIGTSFSVDLKHSIFVHMLEGVMFVTDTATHESRRCAAGDTLLLPKGWNGHIDILSPVKKLWTTAL